MGVKKCSQAGCDRAAKSNGMCHAHNMRQWRGATPEEMAEPIGFSGQREGKRQITCGHPWRRHGARGLCTSCYQVIWMRGHPEANTGNKWLKDHPEEARAHRRKQQLKRRGLTPEQYDRLWTEQQGKCANPNCQIMAEMVMADYRQGLQVDHDHATGRVRGLLCSGCNRALGLVADDRERLLGLITYLNFGLN
jgi:hypothetical protein